MMGKISYKEASRTHNPVGEVRDGYTLEVEKLNCGSLMRIADATELMAKSHADLVRDRDYWKGRAERAEAAAKRGDYRERNLKGQLTKLKKELAVAKLVK